MNCGVYQIKHTASGRCYIGSSKHLRRRLYAHQLALKHQRHHSVKLQRAWDKYGESSFEFSVVVLCAEKDRLDYEQRLIDGLQAFSTGFNMLSKAGNSEGWEQTAEWRKNLKAAQRRSAQKYEWKGEMLCLSEIAEREAVPFKRLMARVLEKGWSIERAVTKPIQQQNRVYAAYGQCKPVKEWASTLNINEATLRGALKRGETIEAIASKQKRMTLAELSAALGLNDFCTSGRLQRGWSLRDALLTPKGEVV